MAEEIDTKSANKTLIIAGLVLAVLVLALLTNGFGLFSKGTNGSVIGQGGEFIPLAQDNSPVLGEADAPLIIYMFSDFSCPFCAAADGSNEQAINQFKASDPTWEAPVPAIIENYVNEGKAKIVFKYFPGHGSGESAHIVALALHEQGLFWKFHDAAFKSYEETSSMSKMKDIARSIGADMTKLEADLKANESKYRAQLQEDYKMGASNGVSGTPAFFINGKLISGARSFSDFQRVIDNELTA